MADSAIKPIYSENPPFRTINLKFGDKDVVARVVYEGENAFRVTVGEREYRATGSAVFHPEANFTELTCDIEGAVSKQRVLVAGPSVRLFTADGSITFEQRLPKFLSQQGRRRRRNSVKPGSMMATVAIWHMLICPDLPLDNFSLHDWRYVRKCV